MLHAPLLCNLVFDSLLEFSYLRIHYISVSSDYQLHRPVKPTTVEEYSNTMETQFWGIGISDTDIYPVMTSIDPVITIFICD